MPTTRPTNPSSVNTYPFFLHPSHQGWCKSRKIIGIQFGSLGTYKKLESLMGSFSGRAKGVALAAAGMGYARKNPDKIKNGLTKAGDLVNKKTHGKYSSYITGAQAKATQAIDKATGGNGRGGINPTSPSNR